MTYYDSMELNSYIKNEWNNDRSWLSSSSVTRKHRTRIEYGMIVRYKLDIVLRGFFGVFLPEPCC